MNHTVRLYPPESAFSTSNLKVSISLSRLGYERSASPLRSPCCNGRLSIFNRLLTTFLESELENVTQFGSLTTPSKEKDEDKPCLSLNFILFTRDYVRLLFFFVFASKSSSSSSRSLDRFLIFDTLFGWRKSQENFHISVAVVYMLKLRWNKVARAKIDLA